jgi:DNA-binding transcriptional MocR family regulator
MGTGDSNSSRGSREVDLKDLLSRPALGIGAGSATDSGFAWILPSEVENPIVLSAGIPDPDSLPVQDLREAFDRVLTESRDQALRYGGVLGFEGLRRALAERYNSSEAIRSGPENFLIGNGSAGCIDNICDAFLDPGDVVIVEGPTFSGSTRTIRGHQAEIVQISLDRHGLRADDLPAIFRRVEESGRRVKLLYTVCDFQNPTGTTLSPERREKIINLCREHQTLIVEDAAYADIYFDVPPPPSIYALAGGQGVLQVGSFSKILAPGLRMGWVRGRGDFIDGLSRVRYDMGNSPLLQRALEAYLQSGKLDHHLGRVRALYARKCETLSQSLRQYCSQYFNFEKPEGGFYLWIDCVGPKARDVRREASKVGVAFPLGATFYLDQERDDSSHLRLAFSTASLSELEKVGPLLKLACDRAVGE